jgi:rhodanese-related sulfurtransferase
VAVPEISVDTLEEHLKDGVPLIDVRQLDEYTDAHVAGARLVPLDELPDRLDEVPTDTPVYLICAVGGRSARASEWLIAQGVDATNVAGGTKAWIEAGKPTVSGEEPG